MNNPSVTKLIKIKVTFTAEVEVPILVDEKFTVKDVLKFADEQQAEYLPKIDGMKWKASRIGLDN